MTKLVQGHTTESQNRLQSWLVGSSTRLPNQSLAAVTSSRFTQAQHLPTVWGVVPDLVPWREPQTEAGIPRAERLRCSCVCNCCSCDSSTSSPQRNQVLHICHLADSSQMLWV